MVPMPGCSATSAEHVVLLGLMGSGKTTIGRALAAHLGWSVSDSDEYIQRATGQTARQLLAAAGVDALHRLEAQHLLDALATAGPAVVCAAASVVDDEACRRA